MAVVHGPEVVERLFFLPSGTLRMVNKHVVHPVDVWLNRRSAAKDANEPPKLVEEKLDRMKGAREHGREGAKPAQSRTDAHLLAPARPHTGGVHSNLHVMTMVTSARAHR